MKKQQYLPFFSSIFYSSPYNQAIQSAVYSKQFSAEPENELSTGVDHESRFFRNYIEILVRVDSRQQMSMNLFNQQGKLVRSIEITGESGLNLMRLDNLDQLSPGAYYLQLNREGETMTRMIIKQ
jgi:hypothetical protein